MVVRVNIGKKGLTEGVLREILKSLKAHGLVLVKFLRNYRQWKERDELTADAQFIQDYLAQELKQHVVMKRIGFTMLYAKNEALLAAGLRSLAHPERDKPFKPTLDPSRPRHTHTEKRKHG